MATVLWRGPIFLLGTSLFGLLALAVSLVDPRGRLQHKIAQTWARFSVFISGCSVEVSGAEILSRYPVAVYASNHLSYMDTPLLFSTLPIQFRIVARHDLWKVPFIGWYLRRSGQVPVHVDNPRASIASLSKAVRALESGMPLFIFPEGGRSLTGQPQPFQNGPAFMALRAQVPLIPIALVGTYELLPMHTKVFHPVRLKLVVGEPILTEGASMKALGEYTQRLQDAVNELYYHHALVKKVQPVEVKI